MLMWWNSNSLINRSHTVYKIHQGFGFRPMLYSNIEYLVLKVMIKPNQWASFCPQTDLHILSSLRASSGSGFVWRPPLKKQEALLNPCHSTSLHSTPLVSTPLHFNSSATGQHSPGLRHTRPIRSLQTPLTSTVHLEPRWTPCVHSCLCCSCGLP